jgi:hypothetical protein
MQENIDKQRQKEEGYRLLVDSYLLKSLAQDSRWNSIEICRSNRLRWQKAKDAACGIEC